MSALRIVGESQRARDLMERLLAKPRLSGLHAEEFDTATGRHLGNFPEMHVHSTASELSKLGIQRSLLSPDCATDPTEVYELAKGRGMDFVTITDHETIAGEMAVADLPDTFISEELTAWFKAEPQAVHVLCYGITPDDHEWLQAHSADLEACASLPALSGLTAARAHPFYAVEAPLAARHRRRLAELFSDLGDPERVQSQ